MAEVVMFHHVQGLTKGVSAIAETLRGVGHTVHVPDLFDGKVFESIEAGLEHVKGIGFEEVIRMGVESVDGMRADLVYVGFSLGVLPAQKLAQTRAGARGAVLVHSCIPVSEFSESWPAGVPVQIHGMDADPEFAESGDLDAARSLVEEAESAELYLYRGSEHLFTDSSLAAFDRGATELFVQRVLAFLDETGDR